MELPSAFWLPLEYGLSHYAHLGSFLTFPEADSTLLVRVSSLFGLLIVSFLVVLINSLILIVSEHFKRALWSRAAHPVQSKKEEQLYRALNNMFLEKRLYYILTPRAPPLASYIPV
jgi:hypothetical protein